MKALKWHYFKTDKRTVLFPGTRLFDIMQARCLCNEQRVASPSLSLDCVKCICICTPYPIHVEYVLGSLL